MSFLNFKEKTSNNGMMRKIKTIRGKKALQKAKELNIKIIVRNVEPFQTVSGKYCIVKNKITKQTYKLHDFRDSRRRSCFYKVITDWTYEYKNHVYPDVAAYVIPDDIQEEEIVFIEDLIENLIGFTYNQGGNSRLASCKAQWVKNDLKILYNQDRDVLKIVG